MGSTPATAKADADLSPLREALDSVAGRRVLLFGGKGGVGKTTLASLAAIHLSRSRPVVLFTTDPASNLADLFSSARANLTIEELDASALYARFLERNLAAFLELGDRGTYLDRDELRRFFELSLPGVDELMAWGRIGELAEEHPDAAIVVDTAPTGHTLRMLGARLHFRQLVEALEAMQEKHRGIVRQLARREIRDAMDAFLEDFSARWERRRAVITAGAFVPVLLSEPWVVEQTRRLIAEVRESGVDVPFAVLNRAASRCDCARCQAAARRDREVTLDVPLVRVPRSCVPLDSAEALERWGRGGEEASRRAGVPGRRHLASSPARPLASVPRLTFLAGKGGVGKTSCATSIALQLAKNEPGKLFTLISVDPAHSVRDVFAHEPPPPNLAVETVDTKAKWRELRESVGEEISRAIDALTPGSLTLAYDREAVEKLIEIAPPGADEIFAVARLADLIDDTSIEAIVVDTAPTGHFLRLLDLPSTAGEWVREFMRILLHYREVIPPGSLGEQLVRASRTLKVVGEALHSRDAAAVVVTRPERIVIAETKRLMAELERRGIAIGGVIANYVTPETGCACDRSMRSHEMRVLEGLDATVIERRDEPLVRPSDLLGLVPVAHSRRG